jgi:hypothetical protein
MAGIRFNDDDDPVDICLDNVFKAVFTKDIPESRGALSGLLSALIGRELTVLSITANEPPIDNLRDRQIRFDIACKAGSGELMNVEMSMNPDAFEPVRDKRRKRRLSWSFMRGSCLPGRTSVGPGRPTMT